MSLVDGSAFGVYHADFLQRAWRSWLVRPAVVYQMTVMAWQGDLEWHGALDGAGGAGTGRPGAEKV
jgi:hypothetical protein